MGTWRAAVLSGSMGFDSTAIGAAGVAAGALCSRASIGCEAIPITSGVAALMRYAL